MLLFSSIVFLSLLSLAFSTYSCGVDIPNNDITTFPLPQDDHLLCKSSCDLDPACVAYAFAPKNCSNANPPSCWLKSIIGPQRANACICYDEKVQLEVSPIAPSSLYMLKNSVATLQLGQSGVYRYTSTYSSFIYSMDSAAIAADGISLNTTGIMPSGAPTITDTSITYSYLFMNNSNARDYQLDIAYVLHDQGHWSKTMTVTCISDTNPIIVMSVAPFAPLAFSALSLSSAFGPTSYIISSGDLGGQVAFIRFENSSVGLNSGVLLSATNPMLRFEVTGLTYPSTMAPSEGLLAYLLYHSSYALNTNTHTCDTAFFSSYTLSGIHVPPLSTSVPSSLFLDTNERDNFINLVDTTYLNKVDDISLINIGWTENDYQIDIANSTQFVEYTRILTQLNRIGVTHLLYGGSDSSVSTKNNATDDWGWEEILWLDLGEDIREGYWTPGLSALPPTTLALINLANSLGVGLVPYVYPILGFSASVQANQWLRPVGNGKFESNLDNFDFQFYFTETLNTFITVSNSQGVGFDYTYFNNPSASVYAQYRGWSNILNTLRNRNGPSNKFVMDQRQANHAWGPWIWGAGSYAEPLQSDEQPESWAPFSQDLHSDRLSANQVRRTNYNYAQEKFAPMRARPGFMHHQTDRDSNLFEEGVRDFDFYGASYSILSAVATAGMNWVVCGIAARDEAEFNAFPYQVDSPSSISVEFYLRWQSWIRSHMEYVLQTKFINVPVGNVKNTIDGTYMTVNSTNSFVFLFNAYSPSLSIDLSLNHDLGFSSCDSSSVYSVEQIYPVEQVLMVVSCNETFTLTLEGKSVQVYSITQGQKSIQVLPSPIFTHNQPVTGMNYNPSFTGGVLNGTIFIPHQVIAQLSARKSTYNLNWTADDLAVSWLAPERLLLHIDPGFAIPSTTSIPALIENQPVQVTPSWNCRYDKAEFCFSGWFIDISALSSDVNHSLSITLPTVTAGSFQGVYYDNVDTIYPA
jgi:PAN domain